MPKGIFVTGTDTDVGKTYASAFISQQLSQLHISHCYYKPIQCGADEAYPLGDRSLFSEICPGVKTHNSYFLTTPSSPHFAFPKDNQSFEMQKIKEDFASLSNNVIIEGAGGLKVPITQSYDMLGLIKDFSLPVIVVSRPGLGTINHTLSTLELLRLKKVEVLCFVFSTPTEDFEISEMVSDNHLIVTEISGVPFGGFIPFIHAKFQGNTNAKLHSSKNLQNILGGYFA